VQLIVSKLGIGGRHVAQALVIALVVVVLGERLDVTFEFAGQGSVFQPDAVLEGLVPALDLALGLKIEWGATHVPHALGLDIVRQFARDVAAACEPARDWDPT
jgi:hypothetical protein